MSSAMSAACLALLALRIASAHGGADGGAFAAPDPKYNKSSYDCSDYTPLARGWGNIVEFRCEDGRCIAREGACNGQSNCDDGSDESERTCKRYGGPHPPKKNEDKDSGKVKKEEKKKEEGKEETVKHEEVPTTQRTTRQTTSQRTTMPPAAPTMPAKAKEDDKEPEKERKALREEKRDGADDDDDDEPAASEEDKKTHEAGKAAACRTAKRGEVCYRKVKWAMKHGIFDHPEWYPQLSKRSSFMEFQAMLAEGKYGSCPQPCFPTTTSTTETTTWTPLSVSATMACSQEHVLYTRGGAMDMKGEVMTIEKNISACQARCRQTPGCKYFSFYAPLKNCHLEDEHAKPQMHNLLFISGPPSCDAEASAHKLEGKGDDEDDDEDKKKHEEEEEKQGKKEKKKRHSQMEFRLKFLAQRADAAAAEIHSGLPLLAALVGLAMGAAVVGSITLHRARRTNRRPSAPLGRSASEAALLAYASLPLPGSARGLEARPVQEQLEPMVEVVE